MLSGPCAFKIWRVSAFIFLSSLFYDASIIRVYNCLGLKKDLHIVQQDKLSQTYEKNSKDNKAAHTSTAFVYCYGHWKHWWFRSTHCHLVDRVWSPPQVHERVHENPHHYHLLKCKHINDLVAAQHCIYWVDWQPTPFNWLMVGKALRWLTLSLARKWTQNQAAAHTALLTHTEALKSDRKKTKRRHCPLQSLPLTRCRQEGLSDSPLSWIFMCACLSIGILCVWADSEAELSYWAEHICIFITKHSCMQVCTDSQVHIDVQDPLWHVSN